MPEILQIPDLALLRADPVADIVVALPAAECLRQDIAFHLLQVLGINHPPEAVAGKLLKFFHGAAAEQLYDVLVDIADFLISVCIINKEPARHTRGNRTKHFPDPVHSYHLPRIKKRDAFILRFIPA